MRMSAHIESFRRALYRLTPFTSIWRFGVDQMSSAGIGTGSGRKEGSRSSVSGMREKAVLTSMMTIILPRVLRDYQVVIWRSPSTALGLISHSLRITYTEICRSASTSIYSPLLNQASNVAVSLGRGMALMLSASKRSEEARMELRRMLHNSPRKENGPSSSPTASKTFS